MSIEVRDKRQKGWSWFDNRVITRMAARIGPHALSVYMALVTHSDEHTQTCYPSYHTLAKELGLSRPTVIKAIQTLVRTKLIHKSTRQATPGDADTNLYTLLDVPWVVNEVDHEVVNDNDHLGNETYHGSQPHGLPVVNGVNPEQDSVQQDSVNKTPPIAPHGGRLPHLRNATAESQTPSQAPRRGQPLRA